MKYLTLIYLEECKSIRSTWVALTLDLNPVFIKYACGVLTCHISYDTKYEDFENGIKSPIYRDAALFGETYFNNELDRPVDEILSREKMLEILNFELIERPIKPECNISPIPTTSSSWRNNNKKSKKDLIRRKKELKNELASIEDQINKLDEEARNEKILAKVKDLLDVGIEIGYYSPVVNSGWHKIVIDREV
jgi:hypothetical protein